MTSESWPAIRTALQRDYVNLSYVTHKIDLKQLFADSRIDDPYRQRQYATELETHSRPSIDFDQLRETANEVPRRNSVLLLLAGVLVDVSIQYPNIERRTATRTINQAIEGERSLNGAGSVILELARTVALGELILSELDVDRFAHPEDDSEKVERLVTESVRTGNFESVKNLKEKIETSANRKWERDYLLEFDGYEFETLLARCWREYRNAAATTQKRQDKGVDIIVETQKGDRLLVQAKRKDPQYKVGVRTVQRTNGTLEQFNGDRAVVVTSSTFTESAKKTAEAVDRLSLIDGQRVCKWLTNSSMIPPLR